MNANNELNSNELVRRTSAGDKEAYGELVTRFQGHVYGLAYSLVNNWADAQDIAQETFIRAYANIDQLSDPNRFPAWLRRITFSVSMNWIKSFRPKLYNLIDGKVDLDKLEIPDFKPDPHQIVEKRELAQAVLGAIDSLPAKYRVPLTMFHLDGLSYNKVADFLDIPLNTVKSLILRAREKLKASLIAYVEEDISPMVQEVLNEHKLPVEFSRKVLSNIPEIRYDKWECAFAGVMKACMDYLHHPVTYDFLMGVSGAAFKVMWGPGSSGCTSNNSLAVLGEEPVHRTCWALGYDYELVKKTNDPDDEMHFRNLVIESIENDRPIISYGIVGLGDEGVLAGYDEGGDIVLGRSYFQTNPKTYYQSDDWYKNCDALVLIGNKKKGPKRRDILKEALKWAVQLAQTTTCQNLPKIKNHHLYYFATHKLGFAAFDAWIDALKCDSDFPEDDFEELTLRCKIHKNITLSGLCDGRRSGVGFLRSMIDDDQPGMADVLKTATLYEEELEILYDAMKVIPYENDPEERRRQIADPNVRIYFAEFIMKAKEKEMEAVKLIKNALEKM